MDYILEAGAAILFLVVGAAWWYRRKKIKEAEARIKRGEVPEDIYPMW